MSTRVLSVLLILAVLAFCFPAARQACLAQSPSQAGLEVDDVGYVYYVVDGDTFDAFPVGRVRLADVDTPEYGEPGYEEAKDALTALLMDEIVFLDVDDVGVDDRYHRLICVVYVRHNSTHLLNVNKWLVVNGYAGIVDYDNEFDPSTWTLYVYAPEDELPDMTYSQLLEAYLETREAYEELLRAFNASPLQVDIASGDVHFPGELVDFYVLTVLNGVPVNASIREALLFYEGSVLANLAASATRVAGGLFFLRYEVPLNASPGTYALFVLTNYTDGGREFLGASVRTFIISPTLTGWNACLMAIQGDLALLKTEVGLVKLLLDEINVTVWDVKGDCVVLRTEVGYIKADLEDLLEMIGEIKGFIEGLSPAQAELSGFAIGFLATSAISGLSTSHDCVLKARLSPPKGRKGLLVVIVPEGLLEHLQAGVDDVIILLDGQVTEFACAYMDEKASYVLGITYGPGEHEVIMHLRDALDDDGDGLENYEELLTGTDPLRPDTDGDLWPDARDPWPKSPAMPDLIIIGLPAAALALLVLRRRLGHS